MTRFRSVRYLFWSGSGCLSICQSRSDDVRGSPRLTVTAMFVALNIVGLHALCFVIAAETSQVCCKLYFVQIQSTADVNIVIVAVVIVFFMRLNMLYRPFHKWFYPWMTWLGQSTVRPNLTAQSNKHEQKTTKRCWRIKKTFSIKSWHFKIAVL